VDLEVHVPVLRPRGEEEDATAVVLQEHGLEGSQEHTAVVLVGRPVVVWPPEGGEALVWVVAACAGDDSPARLVGEAQVGHEDVVLAPTAVPTVPAVFEGREAPFDVGAPHGDEAEGKNGVEFGVFHVVFRCELLGRGEGLLAIDLAERQRRQFGQEFLA